MSTYRHQVHYITCYIQKSEHLWTSNFSAVRQTIPLAAFKAKAARFLSPCETRLTNGMSPRVAPEGLGGGGVMVVGAGPTSPAAVGCTGCPRRKGGPPGTSIHAGTVPQPQALPQVHGQFDFQTSHSEGAFCNLPPCVLCRSNSNKADPRAKPAVSYSRQLYALLPHN